jgi:hypothetical protein
MKKLMFLILAVLITGYAGAQTKTALRTADLNKAITDHIAKSYAGFKIAQAYKVETNKVVTYEVIVQKEATKNTLVYNDKGAFLKAEANKPATVKATNKTTPVNRATSPGSTKTSNQNTGTKPKN